MTRTRLIIANLDCESEYGRKTASSPADRLPDPIRRMLSSAGTLLCCVARPGDRIWTPEPVDRDRVALPGARGVEFVSGPLDRLDVTSCHEILAWGETDATAALRQRRGERPGDDPAPLDCDSAERPDDRLDDRDGWRDALWTTYADPDVARRVNDRRYGQALAEELGVALPGSTVLDGPDELHRHLAAGGHRAGHDDAWVLKAPFSASGRLRVRRRGRDIPQDIATRIRRLFDRFGQLVFEPWVDRVSDFACTGVIGRRRMRLFPAHRLSNDRAGVFRGARMGDGNTNLVVPDEFEGTASQAEQLARTIARRLFQDGYRGPFGVDGFFHRTDDGALRLHPLCEINARMGFGLLARAMEVDHADASVELRLGTGPVPELSSGQGDDGSDGEGARSLEPRIVPLLEPGPGDPTSAWLVLWPQETTSWRALAGELPLE